MGNNGKPWLNDSGCPDPTAYEALKHVQAEEKQRWHHVDDSAHMVITTIKNILDLSGFELIGRIQIKHKKSGKVYK
jgi:hypothetical protein